MPRGRGFCWSLLSPAPRSALLLLQILGGNVSSRIDLQGLSDAGRLSAYRSTLRIIADNPWFGTGLGTFAHAFPAYRSSDMSMRGFGTLRTARRLNSPPRSGLPLARSLRVALDCRACRAGFAACADRDDTIAVPLAALAVSLIALLHSSIDFSLQIAGYSIVVFALLGLGLSQAVLRGKPRRTPFRVRTARALALTSLLEERERSPLTVFLINVY